MKRLFIFLYFIFIYFQTLAQTLIPYLKINGKIIYVDSATMKPVIEKEFDDAFAFAEGFAGVELNGKYGFIDKKGGSLTGFNYEEANSFRNGIARVYVDKKASFIDTSGKEIFPFKYHGLGEFIDGFAFAMQDEKWGYIDRTGKEIVPVKYDWILEFSEGMAKVELNGKYGFVNKTGAEVIPIKYDDALDFSMGLAAVGVNGKYGFIDKKGKEVIPLKYHFTRITQSGLLQVTIDSGRAVYRSGIMDKTGKVIVPLKYSAITEFTKGIYLVKLGNKIQLISGASKKLAEWDSYDSWRNISEGIAFLQIKNALADGGKLVMINNAGKEVSTARFDAVGDFKNGIAPVKTDGKWFFIDKTGKPLFESKYDNIYSFDKGGITRVSLNNRWFYIDKAGREFREKEKPLAGGWLFFDEFKDNRNGWGIDSTSKDFPTVFRSGGYDVWNKRDDQSRFLLRKIPGWNEKNNFRIEMIMHYGAVGPDNMGNGLIIGCDENISNYYRIIFNKKGQYRVDQSIIGKIVPLQDWKESTDIVPYFENKVGFTHINGLWAFYVNEKKIYEMKAKEFFGNQIGMFIGPGSSYYCRSLKVYDWTKAATDPTSPKEPLYDVVIGDNFKTNRYQWYMVNDQYATISFPGDAYRIKNKYDGTYLPSILFGEKDMSAFRVELAAKHTEGVQDYGYGMCLGKKDVDNTWVFYITLDGYFSLYKIENGKWTLMKEWTETDAIYKRNYATNTLKFVNNNFSWDFYINDKLVYSRSAGSFPGRQFGCIVQNKQTVEFTKFSFARIVYP
jgi:WG containing repeat